MPWLSEVGRRQALRIRVAEALGFLVLAAVLAGEGVGASAHGANADEMQQSKHYCYLPFVSREPAPRLSAVAQLGGEVSSVVYRQPYVYVAEADRIVVVDVSVSERPRQIARSDALPSIMHDMVIVDGTICSVGPALPDSVEPDPGVLAVIDLSNALQPEGVGTRGLQGGGYKLAHSESRLYVASGNSGLIVFDISVPQCQSRWRGSSPMGTSKRLRSAVATRRFPSHSTSSPTQSCFQRSRYWMSAARMLPWRLVRLEPKRT